MRVHSVGPAEPQPVGGDSPLIRLEEFSGQVDAVVDVIAFDFGSDTGGSFVVSGVPSGATALRAWLLVTSFGTFLDVPVSATFAGNALGSRLPDAQDPGGSLNCALYRFEVTGLVTGNGTYDYQAVGNSNAYGDALVVVFEHESLPSRTIVIADGAESLLGAGSTCDLGDLPAESGELTLFTEADDLITAGESIAFNGVTVAGPGDLFAANEGPYASLVTVPVTTQAGSNSFEVFTQDDWFGLHLAILELGSVPTITIGFETEDDGGTVLVNGQDVAPGDEFGLLVEIEGFPSSGLTAAIFDSTPGGPNDPSQDVDLLVDQGNLLILQERPLQTVPGIYDRPNDDSGGGRFDVGFLGREALVSSIDLVDIDTGAGVASLVELFDAVGRARRFTVPLGWTEDLVLHGPPGVRTLDLTSLAPQPGFSSTATATQDVGFEAGRVVSMKVWLGGSGAIDNLTFSVPVALRTVDFEDLGVPPGSQINVPTLESLAAGGFVFAPTDDSAIHDLHVGNEVSFWMSSGSTVLAGHGQIRMTCEGGAPFSLLGFDFAGWVGNLERPFSVVASNGTVAHFVPDGICDGIGGAPDFQSFVLPDGFENVESVVFVHDGPGTDYGTFGLDDLRVITTSTSGFGQGSAPAGSPRPVPISVDHHRDPLIRRP